MRCCKKVHVRYLISWWVLVYWTVTRLYLLSVLVTYRLSLKCTCIMRTVPLGVPLKPRLYDTTSCQTGCQSGLTNGCIVYTHIQPVVKPVSQPVWQPAVSCIQPVVKPVVQPGLTTGWTNSGCSFNPVERTVAVHSTRLSNRLSGYYECTVCLPVCPFFCPFDCPSVLCMPITRKQNKNKLECGPIPNVMATLPNIGGALYSTPQNFADAHY